MFILCFYFFFAWNLFYIPTLYSLRDSQNKKFAQKIYKYKPGQLKSKTGYGFSLAFLCVQKEKNMYYLIGATNEWRRNVLLFLATATYCCLRVLFRLFISLVPFNGLFFVFFLLHVSYYPGCRFLYFRLASLQFSLANYIHN